MTIPRGLIAGTLAAMALIWGLFAIDPGRSLVSSGVQTAVFVGLLVLTARSRRVKVLLVRTVQRWTINPLMRLLLAIGINPLGLAILETRGRSSGKPRRVPVGNGRKGDAFWIIAEHGTRAEYVRNIQQDPRVRVRLRVGLRYRWVPGFATVLPDDDPLARQRRIIRWHPLRALNAINVRVLGADLTHRARAADARRIKPSDRDQHTTGARDADRRPDPCASRRAARPVAELSAGPTVSAERVGRRRT